MKALAAREPRFGQMGELYSRLRLGEMHLMASIADSFIHGAKRNGAPVVFA